MYSFTDPEFALPWEMENAERFALVHLLSVLKPEISIEIGTRKGGSLQVISHFSKKVYTLDIDPETTQLKHKFSNVEFIT